MHHPHLFLTMEFTVFAGTESCNFVVLMPGKGREERLRALQTALCSLLWCTFCSMPLGNIYYSSLGTCTQSRTYSS